VRAIASANLSLSGERRKPLPGVGRIRLWQQYGESILWDAKPTILADQLERGWGRVEFVPLSRQYLHLSPLVDVT